MNDSDDKPKVSDSKLLEEMSLRAFYVVYEVLTNSRHPVIDKIKELHIVTEAQVKAEAKKLLESPGRNRTEQLTKEECLLYYSVIYFQIEIYKTELAKIYYEKVKMNVKDISYSYKGFRTGVINLYTKIRGHFAATLKDYLPFAERKRLLDNCFAVN
jgi:hypothetical protein